MDKIIGYGPYIVFLGAVGIFLFLELLRPSKKISMIGLISILFLMFLILTLKSSNVGQDAPAYEKIYNGAKEYDLLGFWKKHKIEPFFYITLYIFSAILKAPSIIFWGLNYSVMCIALFLAFKNTKRPIFYLSVFLLVGFFRMSFSGLRQSIAAAICTLALIGYMNSMSGNFISRKSKIKEVLKYIFLVGLASMYHISSLFLLVIPVVFSIKFDFKYCFIPFIFIPFISEVGGGIFTFICENFSYVGFYQPISGVPSILLLVSIFAFAFYYLFFHFPPISKFVSHYIDIETPNSEDEKYKKNFILFFIYCFFLSCNTFNGALCRFSIYFYICLPFYFDNFLFSFKSTKIKTVFTAVLFAFLVIYFIYEGSTLKIFPYDFIF